jgi:hypothetical protein
MSRFIRNTNVAFNMELSTATSKFNSPKKFKDTDRDNPKSFKKQGWNKKK